MRAAGRRRPADSQPDPRARRRHGLRAGARGDDSRRSRQPLHDARTAQRLLRRGAAPREGGSRRREPPASPTRCRSAATAPGARGAKGVTYERGRGPSAFVRIVSDGYPAAMGIPLRAGRDIAAERHADERAGDRRSTRRMARDAVAGPGSDRQDTSSAPAPRNGASSASSATCAISRSSRRPATRCTSRCASAAISRRRDLVVRSTLPPAQLAGAVRAALQPIAANLPGNDFRTLQQLVDKSVSPRRFLVLLLGGFAGVRAGAGVARHLRR